MIPVEHYRAGRYIHRNHDACIQELCDEIQLLREEVIELLEDSIHSMISHEPSTLNRDRRESHAMARLDAVKSAYRNGEEIT